MDFLIKNKEWIFSGVGVFIFSILWKFVFTKNKEPKNISPEANATNSNNISITNTFPTSNGNKLQANEGFPAAPFSRAKVNMYILFVDDDTRFKVVDILKTAGWIHTKAKKDIINLDDPDAIEANVIFVDINGVGTKLFNDQGLGLSVALKRKYPEKKIVLYSAEQNGDRFHKALRGVDACLPKNAEPYEFINLLENFSNELFT